MDPLPAGRVGRHRDAAGRDDRGARAPLHPQPPELGLQLLLRDILLRGSGGAGAARRERARRVPHRRRRVEGLRARAASGRDGHAPLLEPPREHDHLGGPALT